MRTPRIVGVFILGISLVGAGCASPGKRTGVGAGAGAAGGAIIGGVAGGTKGAVFGGLAGAALGAAVGNYLDKQAEELAQVADTQRTKDGILVRLKSDLLFESGSALLKPPAERDLAELGKVLVKYPEDRIRVAGYTDSTGSEEFNEELSKRRAAAVRTRLAEQGVQPAQILVAGLGEARPVADNSSPTGRAKNRRVELKIDVPTEEESA
jgi:outer membrane protein OmpA-like peptidoglycan-associated protein